MYIFRHDLASRKFAVFLLAIILVLAVGLYHVRAATLPPYIPGYHWFEHKHTLVLFYQSGCGCGSTPEQWTYVAHSHGLDVLIISSQPYPELQSLAKQTHPDTLVYTKFDASALKHISPSGSPVALLIENNRVVLRGVGNSMEAFFGRDNMKGR